MTEVYAGCNTSDSLVTIANPCLHTDLTTDIKLQAYHHIGILLFPIRSNHIVADNDTGGLPLKVEEQNWVYGRADSYQVVPHSYHKALNSRTRW